MSSSMKPSHLTQTGSCSRWSRGSAKSSHIIQATLIWLNTGSTSLPTNLDTRFRILYHTPYSHPYSLKKELERMVDLGIHSDSPYASPLIDVKKDGCSRICIDFLRLNMITVIDLQNVSSPEKTITTASSA